MKRLRIVCALTSIAALGGIGDGLAAIHTSDACAPVNRRVGANR